MDRSGPFFTVLLTRKEAMGLQIRQKTVLAGPIFAIDALSPTGLLGFGGRAIRTPWVEGYPTDAGALEAALRANVVVGASQKGLMCPPGPGFCAAQQRPGLPQIKGPDRFQPIHNVTGFEISSF